MPSVGLSPDEHELLIQADGDGRLVNTLMSDGKRQEEGFMRERACQLMAERGWLKFQGWVRAPGRGSAWTSCWTLTAAARQALEAGDARRDGPESVRSPRGLSD